MHWEQRMKSMLEDSEKQDLNFVASAMKTWEGQTHPTVWPRCSEGPTASGRDEWWARGDVRFVCPGDFDGWPEGE